MNHSFKKCLLILYFLNINLGIDMIETDNKNKPIFEQAIFGAGCFWCVEAIFESIEGVENVQAGYTGGNSENPTYEEICTGKTNHVEVVQLDFNPKIISFKKLMDSFWKSHDPTTLNRQGEDIGTQYRSAVFYNSEDQKEIAAKSLKDADNSDMYKNSIVTEIAPLTTFYPAEEYHQDYYRRNSNAPYCRAVIQPKLKKMFDLD